MNEQVNENDRIIFLVRPRPVCNDLSMPNPPIGLGYLAAALKEAGFKTRIYDFFLRRDVPDDTFVALVQKKRPIFVGITALTSYYTSMKRLCLSLKMACPSIPIVLGGVHVSFLPDHSLQECNADIVVIGEGEATIVDLARYFVGSGDQLHAINGIMFMKGTHLVRTGTRALINDINTIQVPDWGQINPNLYPKETFGTIFKFKEYAPIITTRGCPFNCAYCASCKFWQNKIRFRNPVLVADEIEFLAKKFHVREIQFWDDNLTLKKEHIRQICLEILKRGLLIAMSTPNAIRVDTLDEEIMLMMKRAGFYYLTLSVESGSKKILEMQNKHTNLKIIVNTAFLARKLGFYLGGFFMIGFPGEQESDVMKTLRIAKSLPLDIKIFFLVRPLPGSSLFDVWVKDKEVSSLNWDAINYFNGKVNISSFNPRRLERLQRKAYIETILHINNIFKAIYLRFIKFFSLSQVRWNIRKILYLLARSNAF